MQKEVGPHQPIEGGILHMLYVLLDADGCSQRTHLYSTRGRDQSGPSRRWSGALIAAE
jgi:hypothetical protein